MFVKSIVLKLIVSAIFMHKRAECRTAFDEQVVEDDLGLEVREVEVTVIRERERVKWSHGT